MMGGNKTPAHFFGGESITILAIDQSSTKSGYAIFKDSKLSEKGLINLSKIKKDPESRFRLMCIGLNGLIVDSAPDYVVFENVSMQSNPVTLILLARIQGVIIKTCIDRNLTYTIYDPSSWRKILSFNQSRGVKREELKQQAIQYVHDTFALDELEDVAEAICIGHAFVIHNTKTEGNLHG